MKRQRRNAPRALLSARIRRRIIIAMCVVAGMFLLFNVALLAIYRNRTYPKTQMLGANIGSAPYSQLTQKIDQLKLLPKSITLAYADKKVQISLEDLGVRDYTQRAVNSANQQRSWLPVVNLFKSPELKAPVRIDSKVIETKAKELAATFAKEPVNAHLQIEGTAINITDEQSGYDLDQTKLQKTLMDCLDSKQTKLTVPVKTVQAQVKSTSLKDAQKSLEQQINTAITLKYNDKSRQTTAGDVAKWLVVNGEGYSLSETNIRTYITNIGTSFGIRVKDVNQLAAAVVTALNQYKPSTLVLTAQTANKTYTYCTALRNVDANYLSSFKSKLQSTYSDGRGWSIGGLIEFKEVASGCDFTVWLADPSAMPSFGGVCDSTWSCRMGNNVVINLERWNNASPSWKAAGGITDEYRNMVINHETGHWLNFRDNNNCAGTGQPALVMQQQSIDLRGCTFNAWPTPGELTTLRNRLGIQG